MENRSYNDIMFNQQLFAPQISPLKTGYKNKICNGIMLFDSHTICT